MNGEPTEEHIIGGGRFIGLSHVEILQSLTVPERRIVGNSVCGDFDSVDHRIATLAIVAIERFGVSSTNEVE